jgi:hypothetical protein
VPSFVVDPLLVAAPSPEQEAAELEAWFKGLQAWLDEQSVSPFTWKHFQDCSKQLEEIGRFPSFEFFKNFTLRTGLDVNIGLLSRRLSAFFQADEHALSGAITTQTTVTDQEPIIEPAAILERNLHDLQRNLADGLLCLACDRAMKEPFASKVHLVSAPVALPSEEAATRVPSVRVRGKVEMTDPEAVKDKLPGGQVDQSIPMLFSPCDLDRFVTSTDFFDAQEGGFSAFVKRLAQARHPGDEALPCSLGTEFWGSLEASAIRTDSSAMEKLMRVLAAVVTNNAKDGGGDLRQVRENEAGASSQLQRKRDQAGAWRLTVSSGGAGWRLHYWHIPPKPGQSASIEFSLVLRKQDAVRMADDG